MYATDIEGRFLITGRKRVRVTPREFRLYVRIKPTHIGQTFFNQLNQSRRLLKEKDEEAEPTLILLRRRRQRHRERKFINLTTQRHSTAAKRWALVIAVRWATIIGMDLTDIAALLRTMLMMLAATGLSSNK